MAPLFLPGRWSFLQISLSCRHCQYNALLDQTPLPVAGANISCILMIGGRISQRRKNLCTTSTRHQSEAYKMGEHVLHTLFGTQLCLGGLFSLADW